MMKEGKNLNPNVVFLFFPLTFKHHFIIVSKKQYLGIAFSAQ